MNLNDLDNANIFAKKAQTMFSSQTLEKYKDIFAALDDRNLKVEEAKAKILEELKKKKKLKKKNNLKRKKNLKKM